MKRGITMIAALFLIALITVPGTAHATITGIEGPAFNLVADDGHISGADGLSLYFWGY